MEASVGMARLSIALLLAAVVPASGQDCGTNVITLNNSPASPSTAAVRDTGNTQSHAAYNLGTGFAQVNVASSFMGGVEVRVTDVYTLVGPGSNASFQARIHVLGNGSTNCNFRQQCSSVGGTLFFSWNGNSAGQ